MGSIIFTATNATSWGTNPNVAQWNAVRAQVLSDLAANLTSPAGDIHVGINFGYGDVNSLPLDGGAAAQSMWFISTDIYANFRTKLQAIAGKNSLQTTAYNNTNLPSTNPFGASSLYSTDPLLKAIGIIGDFVGVDGYVGVSTNAAVDPTSTHGTSATGWGLYGLLMHEITEVLGRSCNLNANSTYYMGDLFSWSSAGVRDFTNASGRYASGDGGMTKIWDYASSGDFGDLAMVGSAFDTSVTNNLAVSRGSTPQTSLLANDWKLLTVLGYGLSSSSGLAAAGLAPPAGTGARLKRH